GEAWESDFVGIPKSPDLSLYIKPFALLRQPSPELPRRIRANSKDPFPSTKLIADDATENPWAANSIKSNRRVSFAPLPVESLPPGRDSFADSDLAAQWKKTSLRRASPPPEYLPEDTCNADERFRNHFAAISR